MNQNDIPSSILNPSPGPSENGASGPLPQPSWWLWWILALSGSMEIWQETERLKQETKRIELETEKLRESNARIDAILRS